MPTFALPLSNAALAFARLADPAELGEPRRAALKRIASAMMAFPEMVAGTRRLDTDLMRAAKGRVVAKGGAEGYYGIGILASPGLGVAIKMEDGDGARGRDAVVVETLRQLGALDAEGLAELSRYAARPTRNHRGLLVGEIRPCFHLTP